VCFPGTKLADSRYLDSENIEGSLEEQYQRGMAFIKRNLHHVQGNQSVNSLGVLEVPEEAFVELLVNALVHRDFFINATVRLFIFADRVEIISPGHLPDSLTPEQIRAGVSNRRNKVLAEHASHILPYRGLGTGIPRALGAWPKIDLIDVTPEVLRMLAVITGEMSRGEIMAQLGLKDEKHFREHYQQTGIGSGVIEMTIPDKPQSSKQRYRLTKHGRAVLADQKTKEPKP